MEFSSFTYDSSFGPFSQEVLAFEGQQISGEFEAAECTIDTNFADGDSLAPSNTPWAHPSMQRFLKDTQRITFFNPMPQPQMPGLGEPVTPIPPAASHGHQASPFSSHEPSSCSSARSLAPDTELYTENTPSTPPDMALFTPYQAAIHFEAFEPQSQLFLSGMGSFSGESHPCVSMADVNSAEEAQNDWKDSGIVVDFNSPQRSYSYGSQASASATMSAMESQGPVDHNYKRMFSPEEMITVVKDEIQIPGRASLAENPKSAYPTPSVGGSEDDSEGEIDVAPPKSDDDEDDDDDDDDDYQPNKKWTSSSACRANRSKRDAPKRSLERGVAKKARISSSTSRPAKMLPPSISGGKGPLTCPDCSSSFKDECTLQVHIKKQHTRPFICVFRFAGCDSTFASKNEWKRHVTSQHLVLCYWLCDIEACAHNKNGPGSPQAHGNSSGSRSRGSASRRAENTASTEPVGPALPNGAIFNRKDLYTQHLRRMHTPSHIEKGPSRSSKKTSTSSSSSSQKSPLSVADWENQIKSLQSRALRERCQLPTSIQCPAPHCTVCFNGVDAWDQRMEHVAKHLEKAAAGIEEPVVFGGPTDMSLMAWVTSPEIAVVRPAGPGRWVLNNPLRSAGEGRGVGKKRNRRSPSSAATSPAVGGEADVSVALSTADPAIKSEIVVDSSDEDAEGEEE